MANVIRKKGKRLKICFNCGKEIKKGQWYHIHDNVMNKVNPKCFCCKECKLDYLFNKRGLLTIYDF